MSEEQKQQGNDSNTSGTVTVQKTSKGGCANLFAVIGFILGVPVSYYFQSELIRAKLTLPEYLTKLPNAICNIIQEPDKEGFRFILTILISCVVLAIIGKALGRAIDNK